MEAEIAELEKEIGERMARLQTLRASNPGTRVPDYSFAGQDGPLTLTQLLGAHDQLLMIHNMGQGCRYCTLWADGFNGLLPHLENAMSIVLVSKDAPELQRTFANSRGWRFRLASHSNSAYLAEQSVTPGQGNTPGAVLYERRSDGIYRKNICAFGPGDIYCAMWSLLGLAGKNASDWTPQFNYWQQPAQLDDGGENRLK